MTTNGPLVQWLEGAGLRGSFEIALHDGLLVFPTDTVYGLLGLIDSAEQYQDIFRLKGRDSGKPLAVLIERDGWIHEHIRAVLEAGGVARDFVQGKTTAVLREDQLPDYLLELTAWLKPSTLGLRCPNHPLLQRSLLQDEYINGLWATSVNRSGEPPATTAEEVLEWLDSLDEEQRGLLSVVALEDRRGSGRPSRVVDLTGPEPRVLR